MCGALAPIEVLAPATIEKAASLLLTLQQMEKRLAIRLKEWVKENGPIKVGDLFYGPTLVVSYDLDPQTITMILLESGLTRDEIWPFRSHNKTNLERCLRKLRRKDLYELAISTWSQKITERVDFRKASE